MAEILAVTLGPTKGSVLSWSKTKERPEMLHDSATIARRIVQVPDRREDVGAMLLRQMIWQLHQRVGDGGATAATLAKGILEAGTRMIAAGATPVFVQRGIEKGVKQALTHIKTLSQPVENDLDLTAVAEAVTGHPELAFVLGEMFDILGPQAHITVEKYVAPTLDRIYLEGGRWGAKIASPYFFTSQGTKEAVLKDCFVVIYDGNMRRNDGLPEVLDLIAQQETPHLLFVVPAMEDAQIGLLSHAHHNKENKLKIVPCLLDIGGDEGRIEMSDLSLLTGATILGERFGRTLSSIRAADLGRVKRVEANQADLFVIQGNGDRKAIQTEIEQLQNRLDNLEPDESDIPHLERRIARLSGNTGILQIGAHHQSERDVLYEKALHGIRALKSTLLEGYLPGGGVTFLHAAEAIDLSQAENRDEELGMLALKEGLAKPFHRILTNAGIEAPAVQQNRVMASGQTDTVFDVVTETLGPARACGVLDPTRVVREALESAASCAVMALSIDTTILKKKPRMRRNVDP